jgi:hypothetical protein
VDIAPTGITVVLATLEGYLAVGVEADSRYLVARFAEDLGVPQKKLVEHGLELGVVEN